MSTVLIYRLGSLGDTVIALPIFNRIAELYPHHRRVVLTNTPVSSKAPPLLSVVGVGNVVHEAITYPIGARRLGDLVNLRAQIRAHHPELLIYAMPSRSITSVARDYVFLKSCGIRNIIGLSFKSELRVTGVDTKTGETEYELDRLARALQDIGPFNLRDRNNWDLHLDAVETSEGDLHASGMSGRPFVIVNMGGKVARNDWGRDNWEQLTSRLSISLDGWGMMIVGSQDDTSRAEAIREIWSGAFVNLCGKTSPRVTAAAMRSGSFFLGHDSGPMHLANAVGLPCVALFSEHNRPHKWHPYLGDNIVLHEMRGIMSISVEDAFQATMTMARRVGQVSQM